VPLELYQDHKGKYPNKHSLTAALIVISSIVQSQCIGSEYVYDDLFFSQQSLDHILALKNKFNRNSWAYAEMDVT